MKSTMRHLSVSVISLSLLLALNERIFAGPLAEETVVAKKAAEDALGRLRSAAAAGSVSDPVTIEANEEEWLRYKKQLCTGAKSMEAEVGACLRRLYEVRSTQLQRATIGSDATVLGTSRDMLPGESLALGGDGGPNFWAVARCGMDRMDISPGGILASTGRSILYPTEGAEELSSMYDSISGEDDVLSVQVGCRLASGDNITAVLRLEKPLGEGSGTCAASFGALMTISVNQGKLTDNRPLLGYCDAALLKSVAVTAKAAQICTLAKSDDPDRNDPVNILSDRRECHEFHVER